MTRKKYRLLAVLLQLIAQVMGGVVLFAMAPQAIFADIGSDPLAQLCLRLAVYSNAGMAIFTIFVIANTSKTRWLACPGRSRRRIQLHGRRRQHPYGPGLCRCKRRRACFWPYGHAWGVVCAAIGGDDAAGERGIREIDKQTITIYEFDIPRLPP